MQIDPLPKGNGNDEKREHDELLNSQRALKINEPSDPAK
jgi:hypothetical protein